MSEKYNMCDKRGSTLAWLVHARKDKETIAEVVFSLEPHSPPIAKIPVPMFPVAVAYGDQRLPQCLCAPQVFAALPRRSISPGASYLLATDIHELS